MLQIEDRFGSLEEILTAARAAGLTYRIGCAPEESGDFDDGDVVMTDFSAEMSAASLSSFEKTLDDAAPDAEKEESVSLPGEETADAAIGEDIRKAAIVYIDLFLKKSYKYTLIAEKSVGGADSENPGKTVYEIVATAETPLC